MASLLSGLTRPQLRSHLVPLTKSISHGLSKPSSLPKLHSASFTSKTHNGFSGRTMPFFYKAAGVAGVGLGMAAWTIPTVYADGSASPSPAPATQPVPPGAGTPAPPKPPSSTVNMFELTFGSVCGICAGVFLKKGAKMVAFVLGGTFVLLQYFASVSGVRVNWTRIGSRFENMFYTTDSQGVRHAPSVGSLWGWVINFLTADFQPRASFIAGLALGIRIG
ncbi:hypothetical protein HGRIS_013162 [Hohenbuehelia grisea]|uniref:FUN14 family protein n=1 Tax=Hohenbuehelia grisea TaxID=104357 RepID=A0ABR3IUQ1_9AGAR